MRQCHADVDCLVCHKPITLKLPTSANCIACGATYVASGRAKVTNNKQNDLVVLQMMKITGQDQRTGNPIAREEILQWSM